MYPASLSLRAGRDQRGHHFLPHFTNEETEALRGHETCWHLTWQGWWNWHHKQDSVFSLCHDCTLGTRYHLTHKKTDRWVGRQTNRYVSRELGARGTGNNTFIF